MSEAAVALKTPLPLSDCTTEEATELDTQSEDEERDDATSTAQPQVPEKRKRGPETDFQTSKRTLTTTMATESKPVHPFFTKRATRSSASVTTITTTTTTTITTIVVDSSKTVSWATDSSVLVGTYRAQTPGTRIAAFDFDGTLSVVRGTHVHPKGPDDWAFFHLSIPKRLFKLHSEGYRIVIMSNQKGIGGADSKNRSRKSSFMGRMENLIKAVEAVAAKEGVSPPPILILGAMEDDWFRKPRPGMWELFESTYNEGVPVDRGASLYVGDAAGRPAGWIPGFKKDHSDSDLKFAMNVGCGFHTAEGFFHPPGAVVKYPPVPPITFIPAKYPKPASLFTPTSSPLLPSQPTATSEVIVFVGSPASGKSSFARRHLISRGYIYINQDTLKTRDKCVKACRDALKQGKSVVIDNTNPEKATRKLYVDAAKEAGTCGVPVRCFHFTAEEALCMHNNTYRRLGQPRAREEAGETGPAPAHANVPTMAFRFFAKKLQEPDSAEGFTEIKKIHFVPEFGSDVERRFWELFYV
ncbi:hypothetical protein HK104_011446 [Borealophlyctis nickersoniae]|nr:hypothetical protein HK104_011446 [Borealophlyctis nickersoniae]